MTYRIELQPSGNTFNVEEGEDILNAGLAAGYQLAYSCRRGTCSTCRCRIISGKVDYGEYLESMLPEEMKADGYVLLCQATALSDVVLDAQELSVKAQPPREVPCRVKAIEMPVSDVAVVNLRLPQNEGFKHLAGQYIDILLPDGKRRAYSIANAPSPHGVIDIELHIRHSPGGLFTDRVFSEMKARDLLRFEGPLGTMYLREDSDKPVIFVASGTGFAPIKAILEYAFDKGIDRPITLYWGGRRPKDLYMRDLVEDWARDHANFTFVPVISDALPEDAWEGRTGFVHSAALEDHPDMSGLQAYVCGNSRVVDAARSEYRRLGNLPAEEFFADPFVEDWQTAKQEPAA